MVVLAPHQVKSPIMNFINSNAAGVCEEGLGAATGFNICCLHFHSICKASVADQAVLCKLLYKPNRDTLPETQHLEPEQDTRQKNAQEGQRNTKIIQSAGLCSSKS